MCHHVYLFVSWQTLPKLPERVRCEFSIGLFHDIWWHKHDLIWIEVLHKLSTVGVVWIELLQVHTYACTLFVQILRSTFVSFTVIVSWPFWTHARFALAIHLRFSSSILLGQDQQRGVLRKKGSHTWYPYRFGWVMRKKAKTGSGSTFFSACVLVTDLIDHLQGKLLSLLPQLVEKTVKIFSVQVPLFFLVPTWGCYHWSPVVFYFNRSLFSCYVWNMFFWVQ